MTSMPLRIWPSKPSVRITALRPWCRSTIFEDTRLCSPCSMKSSQQRTLRLRNEKSSPTGAYDYRLIPKHPIDALHRLDDRLILIGSLYFVAVQDGQISAAWIDAGTPADRSSCDLDSVATINHCESGADFSSKHGGFPPVLGNLARYLFPICFTHLETGKPVNGWLLIVDR